MPYKGYNEVGKKSALKYKQKKQHPVSLSYKKEVFDNYIAPAIKRSGLGVATFFKIAAQEKIERDHLADPVDLSKDLSHDMKN